MGHGHYIKLQEGSTLKLLGESPAVDYWQHRETNYVKVQRRTGDNGGGEEAVTTFWVVRAAKDGETFPAAAHVEEQVANDIVDLLTMEGEALELKLAALGIVVGEKYSPAWAIDRHAYETYFEKYAVVLHGHLVREYWPLYRRRTQERLERFLCTCATP